jgi:hemoglobin/transferrin/lactoferrin receptor protein
MKRILSAVVCLIFPFIVSSQSKTESSKVDTNRLEEVVVVSSRFKQKKKDIAQQVQIINADRLQQLNAPSTADVLQQTAGIMVQKSQLGGGSPIIRGFEASRVLLVVDGIRLNNAIYRSGHLQNVITIDHNSLDRMEVGYGPSSVAYGSDALGGVVHFFTKQPLLNEISASAFTRYSSAANERTGGFSVNFGKQNWASFSKAGSVHFMW